MKTLDLAGRQNSRLRYELEWTQEDLADRLYRAGWLNSWPVSKAAERRTYGNHPQTRRTARLDRTAGLFHRGGSRHAWRALSAGFNSDTLATVDLTAAKYIEHSHGLAQPLEHGGFYIDKLGRVQLHPVCEWPARLDK